MNSRVEKEMRHTMNYHRYMHACIYIDTYAYGEQRKKSHALHIPREQG